MCHCGSSCNNNCKKIAFKFSTKDPNFTSQNVVVNPSNTNYISHAFVRCPIYNSKNKVMGYKVSDDYVQQVGTNKYVVRLNNTYTFLSNNKSVGSISWQYVFENDIFMILEKKENDILIEITKNKKIMIKKEMDPIIRKHYKKLDFVSYELDKIKDFIHN